LKITGGSKSVTEAWIFGKEITKDEYARF